MIVVSQKFTRWASYVVHEIRPKAGPPGLNALFPVRDNSPKSRWRLTKRRRFGNFRAAGTSRHSTKEVAIAKGEIFVRETETRKALDDGEEIRRKDKRDAERADKKQRDKAEARAKRLKRQRAKRAARRRGVR